MDWLILITSGALEAVWAQALAASKGFRRLVPVLIFLVAMVVSMLGLAYGMRTIPTGTAYAVWVGVGASLTVVWSILTKTERATRQRIVLLAILIACVVGLQVVS